MLLHDTRRLLFRRDRETNRQIRRHTQTHRVQSTFTVSIHNHSRHHTYKHFHTTWPIPSMQRAHPLLNVLTTPPLSFLPPCLPPPLFMASRCCHDRASVAHDHDHASASSHRQPLPSLAWSSSWPSTAAAAALSLSRCCCCCCCCCCPLPLALLLLLLLLPRHLPRASARNSALDAFAAVFLGCLWKSSP